MHTLIGYNYRHSSTSSTKWLHLVEYKASCQCRWAAIWGKQDQARNDGTPTTWHDITFNQHDIRVHKGLYISDGACSACVCVCVCVSVSVYVCGCILTWLDLLCELVCMCMCILTCLSLMCVSLSLHSRMSHTHTTLLAPPVLMMVALGQTAHNISPQV